MFCLVLVSLWLVRSLEKEVVFLLVSVSSAPDSPWHIEGLQYMFAKPKHSFFIVALTNCHKFSILKQCLIYYPTVLEVRSIHIAGLSLFSALGLIGRNQGLRELCSFLEVWGINLLPNSFRVLAELSSMWLLSWGLIPLLASLQASFSASKAHPHSSVVPSSIFILKTSKGRQSSSHFSSLASPSAASLWLPLLFLRAHVITLDLLSNPR